MQPRPPINSQTLQQRFPKIYQNFFAKCQIVVSAPLFFLWAGEYIGYHGGLTLGQKIPIRIYVGLESSPKSFARQTKIQIAHDGKSFSWQTNHFEEDYFEELALLRLSNFLSSYFKKEKEHLTIHFLSEAPFESLGSIGAMTTALATALSLKFSLLTTEQIQQWKETTSSSLIQNKELGLDPIFRLAWKISVAYRDGKSSGLSVFNSLLPTKYPIAYSLERKEKGKVPAHIGSRYELIDKANYWGGRIKEIFKIKREPSWPIDFGIIILGQPRGSIAWPISEIKESIRSVNQFIKSHISNFLGSQGAHIKPLLYQNRYQNKKEADLEDSWKMCLEVMDFLSFKLLTDIGRLLKSDAQENCLKDTLNTINKSSLFSALLGAIPSSIENIFSIIQEKAKKVDILGAGVKMNAAIRKGEILFAVPPVGFRQIITSVLYSIQKALPEINVSLAYASWLDGFEEEGVKVEQYLEKAIYSGFISPNSIFIREYNKTSKPRMFILSPEEFSKQRAKVALILDKQRGKIYIKGKPLSSKEIHSTKMTIEILNKLLQANKKEVSNRSFSPSAYTTSRYELQGKIVTPLRKALKKRTDQRLNLEVRGGITDFTMRFKLDNLKVWIIESQVV